MMNKCVLGKISTKDYQFIITVIIIRTAHIAFKQDKQAIQKKNNDSTVVMTISGSIRSYPFPLP